MGGSYAWIRAPVDSPCHWVLRACRCRSITGVFNFTNPGVVSHNEVLELYKTEIDPSFWYANFSEEEQAKILKAGRCNNHLDVAKLVAAVPDIPIPDARAALKGVYARMAAAMKAAGAFPPPPRKGPKPEAASSA